MSDARGQVTSFVLKIAIVVALLGFIAVEFASPMVTRLTLDNDAQNIAQDAAHDLNRLNMDTEATIERLEPTLQEAGVELRSLDVADDGDDATVRVTVAKEAKSFVAYRIDSLESYYDVEVTASAPIRP